jgi:hypothetical protein
MLSNNRWIIATRQDLVDPVVIGSMQTVSGTLAFKHARISTGRKDFKSE